MSEPKVIHVLWSPQQGPTVGYYNPEVAWSHARSMLGVDVAQVEIRTQLPEVVKTDLETHEYDEDEETPVDAVVIDVGELDENAERR